MFLSASDQSLLSLLVSQQNDFILQSTPQLIMQGLRHEIWSGLGNRCVCKHTTSRGIWGHAPPETFLNLEAMRLLLGPFLGQNNASRGQMTEFYMHQHLPFLPVAPYTLVSAFLSFADLTSHTLCRSFTWKNGNLLKDSGFGTVCSHLVLSFEIQSPCCVCVMGICQALALFGDAKQAMGQGKSGPVETRLTGPAATALLCSSFCSQFCIC